MDDFKSYKLTLESTTPLKAGEQNTWKHRGWKRAAEQYSLKNAEKWNKLKLKLKKKGDFVCFWFVEILSHWFTRASNLQKKLNLYSIITGKIVKLKGEVWKEICYV